MMVYISRIWVLIYIYIYIWVLIYIYIYEYWSIYIYIYIWVLRSEYWSEYMMVYISGLYFKTKKHSENTAAPGTHWCSLHISTMGNIADVFYSLYMLMLEICENVTLALSLNVLIAMTNDRCKCENTLRTLRHTLSLTAIMLKLVYCLGPKHCHKIRPGD